MFQWLTSRITRARDVQRAPQTNQSNALACGASLRRGITKPPLQMVRQQSRRANRVARTPRQRNRA